MWSERVLSPQAQGREAQVPILERLKMLKRSEFPVIFGAILVAHTVMLTGKFAIFHTLLFPARISRT